MYDFEADGIALKPGDSVVVESEMGLSIGTVVKGASQPAEGREYKKVLRLASEDDIRETKANRALEHEAFEFCKERIMARGLLMKLIRTEATLDKKRIVFYFVSEKRIDFRELVKDLAQKFRTRIEMRQVGVRDEAKMTGGLGLCGRRLCCSTFLVDFAPISIKMAKKQELVLNTGKLSGVCGRLMCCLSYEFRGGQNGEETVTDELPPGKASAGLEDAAAPEEKPLEHEKAEEAAAPAGQGAEENTPPEAGAVPRQDEGQDRTEEQKRRRRKRWRKRGKKNPQ